jgi:hypothetical protein
MNIFNKLVVLYFIVIFLLVHCSLFFCNEDHCICRVSTLPISRELAYYMRVGISNMIPLQFKTIQLFAQWVIIFEGLALLVVLLKVFRSIVSCMCQLIFLALLLALATLLYQQYQKRPEQTLNYIQGLSEQAFTLLARLWEWLEREFEKATR